MNENILVQYNSLKNIVDVTSTAMYVFCKGKVNDIGLLPDEIWLHDPKCLQLKKAFREAEHNLKLFIKLNKQAVKQIQKEEHEIRRNRFKI